MRMLPTTRGIKLSGALNVGRADMRQSRWSGYFKNILKYISCLRSFLLKVHAYKQYSHLRNLKTRQLLPDIMHYSKIVRTFSLSPAFTLVIGAMKKWNKQ